MNEVRPKRARATCQKLHGVSVVLLMIGRLTMSLGLAELLDERVMDIAGPKVP
jgi:hypothetical protein